MNGDKAAAEGYDRPLDTAEADVLISITEWVSGKKKRSPKQAPKCASINASPRLYQSCIQ